MSISLELRSLLLFHVLAGLGGDDDVVVVVDAPTESFPFIPLQSNLSNFTRSSPMNSSIHLPSKSFTQTKFCLSFQTIQGN